MNETEQQTGVRIAAVIAGGMIAGFTASIPGLTAKAASVAALMFLLVPAKRVKSLGEAEILSFISPVSAAITSSSPGVEAGTSDPYRIFRARIREEYLMRGYFAVNAVRRLFVPGSIEEIRARVPREIDYFRRHLIESAKRVRADATLAALALRHGPILGWSHGKPENPRLAHMRSDGKNFDVRSPLPPEIKARPGVLYGCTCRAVAPFSGADLINGLTNETLSGGRVA